MTQSSSPLGKGKCAELRKIKMRGWKEKRSATTHFSKSACVDTSTRVTCITGLSRDDAN